MSQQHENLLKRIRFLNKIGRCFNASDLDPGQVQTLNDLVSDGRILKKDYFYFLPEYLNQDLFDENHEIQSNILFDTVKKYLFVFNSCPFIKEIAICNSLAFGVPDKESDIDLLIVIDANRFFMGRLFLSVFLHLFGIRRHDKKISGRFCLSFFVADDMLDFSDLLIENDVYFYYWFYYLQFLKGDFAIQNDLLNANKWFFESNFSFKNLNLVNMNLLGKTLQAFLGLKLFDILEAFMSKMQLKRALNKYNKLGAPFGVVVKKGLLKFHVIDIRREFRDNFYLSRAK